MTINAVIAALIIFPILKKSAIRSWTAKLCRYDGKYYYFKSFFYWRNR